MFFRNFCENMEKIWKSELMPKKSHQNFWRIKHHFFGKKLGFSGKSSDFSGKSLTSHEFTANCREIWPWVFWVFLLANLGFSTFRVATMPVRVQTVSESQRKLASMYVIYSTEDWTKVAIIIVSQQNYLKVSNCGTFMQPTFAKRQRRYDMTTAG